MSGDFDGGGGDRIASNASFTLGTLFSGGGWLFPRSMGVNNQGRMFLFGDSGQNRYMVAFNLTAGSNKLRFYSGRATTTGAWDLDAPLTLSKWTWFAMSYDGGNVANHPTFYTLVNGVFSVLTQGAGLTRTTTPSGAQHSDNHFWHIGAQSDSTQEYNGLLDGSFCYNRILDASEFGSIALRGAASVLRGQQVHWAINRFNAASPQVMDLSGNGRHGILNGPPTLGENPPARSMAGALLAA